MKYKVDMLKYIITLNNTFPFFFARAAKFNFFIKRTQHFRLKGFQQTGEVLLNLYSVQGFLSRNIRKKFLVSDNVLKC